MGSGWGGNTRKWKCEKTYKSLVGTAVYILHFVSSLLQLVDFMAMMMTTAGGNALRTNLD